KLLELLRLLEKVDDFLQFFFRFVHTCNIFKRDLFLVGSEQARAALAERESFVATALHLAHEEDPETYQKKERRPRNECCKPRALTGLFARDLHLLIAEHVDQFWIVHRHHGFKRFSCAVEVSGDIGIGNRDILHVAAFYLLQEAAEWENLCA